MIETPPRKPPNKISQNRHCPLIWRALSARWKSWASCWELLSRALRAFCVRASSLSSCLPHLSAIHLRLINGAGVISAEECSPRQISPLGCIETRRDLVALCAWSATKHTHGMQRDEYQTINKRPKRWQEGVITTTLAAMHLCARSHDVSLIFFSIASWSWTFNSTNWSSQ
jgi:hypothetical protein